MRSYRANNNLIAVSAGYRETAINTEKALDLTIAAALGDVFGLNMRREDNSNEVTGMEEPDYIYDNGATSQASLNFSKAQPQHFSFLLAYALGYSVDTAAGTGYLHTITPIAGDLDNDRSIPSFSAMQRYGKTVLKRRFMSMFVEGFTASFKKDAWVDLKGTIKGTGKYIDNVIEETVSAAGNATSLVLAANAVHGSTAADRLDNVQRIRIELLPGLYREITATAVSAATPGVITITPNQDGTVAPLNYHILYVPAEAAAFTFPARVQETPLRISEMYVNMGCTWNGTMFTGGRVLTSEINGIEWKFANKLKIEFVPGAGGAYATSCFREGREQTVSLDRKFREMIVQRHLIDNTTFGLHILAEGALYDGSNHYQVEIIFPKLAVLKADLKVEGKIMAEAGDLQVLEDATYGSVIVKIKNLQAGYAR